MRPIDEVKQELEEKGDVALNVVKMLMDSFDNFLLVDLGVPEEENEEELQNFEALLIERDRKMQLMLKYILCNYGNFLFR